MKAYYNAFLPNTLCTKREFSHLLLPLLILIQNSLVHTHLPLLILPPSNLAPWSLASPLVVSHTPHGVLVASLLPNANGNLLWLNYTTNGYGNDDNDIIITMHGTTPTHTYLNRTGVFATSTLPNHPCGFAIKF